jgi:hypothetical protein
MLADAARAQAEQARYLAQVRSAEALFATAELGTAEQKKARNIWAGLSVNHPIFKAVKRGT